MLEDPSFEFVRFHAYLFALQVVAHEVHGVRSSDLPTQSRHRQTTFEIGPLAVGLDDRRVHHHDGTVTLVVDEEPFLNPDLVGREAHARSLVHGRDHRFGELGDASVDIVNFGSDLVEDGVTVGSNWQRAHPTTIPPAAFGPALV